MAILTNHGEKRLRERAGLPRKATQGSADRVLKEGLNRTELSGSLRRYVDSFYLRDEYAKKNIKIYGNMIYIFEKSKLITAFVIPRKYIKTVNTIMDKKRKDVE